MRAFVLYVTLWFTASSCAKIGLEALKCLGGHRQLSSSQCDVDASLSSTSKLLRRNRSAADGETIDPKGSDKQDVLSVGQAATDGDYIPPRLRNDDAALPGPRFGGGFRGSGSRGGSRGGGTRGSGSRSPSGYNSNNAPWRSGSGASSDTPWRGSPSSSSFGGSSQKGSGQPGSNQRGGGSGFGQGSQTGGSQSQGGNPGLSQGGSQSGGGSQQGGYSGSQNQGASGNQAGGTGSQGQLGGGNQQGGFTGASQGNQGSQQGGFGGPAPGKSSRNPSSNPRQGLGKQNKGRPGPKDNPGGKNKENKGGKGNQTPKNGGGKGKEGKGNQPGKGGDRGDRGKGPGSKPTRTRPRLLPFAPTDVCQCQPAMCELRGREGCECRAGAATWCISQQPLGCPAPFVESCDNLPHRPILASRPPPRTYVVPQTYMECVGPGCKAGQTTITTITTVAEPPWWTPYGTSNPYKYPGYPAAPTAYPNPPPPPPPIGVPLTVTVPIISTVTATVRGWNSTFTTVTPTPTRTTVVTVIQPVQQVESYAKVSPAVVVTGYVPAEQTTWGTISQTMWGENPRTIWNTITETAWQTAVQTAWRTETRTILNQGPTVYITKTMAGEAITITVTQPANIPPRISSEDLGPVTITVTVDEPIVGGPASHAAGDGRTTLTIPAETISVEGQQPITIPMSVVTVTDWPPRAPGAVGPTAPNRPTPAPVLPDGMQGKIGWTAIVPEAPFTPGPSSRAASTAFYEPAASGLPGVPIFEAPAKCGPNSPRCDDDLYCDPQPLCGGWTSCPGVCLPVYGGKFSLPPAVRNQIWDKVMAEGIYKADVVVKEVRYLSRSARERAA